MFGVPLYYDDGSLMHSGMFFDIDTGVSVRDGRVEQHDIIRVEHFAKGAPPDTPAFLVSRQVPAVTGAFIFDRPRLVRGARTDSRPNTFSDIMRTPISA